MNAKENNFIPEEEAELYDRQIRLWGADVQRSLRNLRVLVIGIRGIATEVCKNLILSGVKSLTMMDQENVTEDNLSSQYFLYPSSVGQNRAEASLKSAQVLNPNVKVSADKSSPLDKPISYFSNFDIICSTKQSIPTTILLNDICKLYKIRFFCGDCFGRFGYLFEDLNFPDSDSTQASSTPISFRTALEYKWSPKTSLKKRSLEDPSYLVFKILTDFQQLYNRYPTKSSRDSDLLLHLRKSVLTKFNAEEDILSTEYLENVEGEFPPTCSIIGGMIAQEVVKSLSKEDSVPYNIYLFNHLRCQLTGTALGEVKESECNGVTLDIE